MVIIIQLGAIISPTILLILLILLLIFFGMPYIRKNRLKSKSSYKLHPDKPANDEHQIDRNENFIIPETCPHCKNPNSKRIRLCEWCGNQIV
jgi:hypothetical protein